VQRQDKTNTAYTGFWRVVRCCSLMVFVSFLRHARVPRQTHTGS